MPPGQTILTVGFTRVGRTFRSLSQFKQLFRYLPIMTFYLAGMQIVIWFAGTIAKELFELTEGELAVYIVVLTVMALVGAVFTLWIQDRIGTRTTILVALGIWLPVMAAAGFATPERQWLFWVLGTGIGLGIGMLGTSSRSMVGLFSPHHKAAEFFGFYGLAHKFAAILGLGWTILAEEIFSDDQYSLVVASSAVFFIAGIGLMFTVNEKAGRIAAMKASRAHERTHRDYRAT
jgi:UMF1 family MFS transporter